MGRGRAKAKQTKVARQLKYSSGGTDLDRLQAELAGEHANGAFGISADSVADDEDEDEDEDDEFSSYGYTDEDDEELA